jgi:hypothetical protein
MNCKRKLNSFLRRVYEFGKCLKYDSTGLIKLTFLQGETEEYDDKTQENGKAAGIVIRYLLLQQSAVSIRYSCDVHGLATEPIPVRYLDSQSGGIWCPARDSVALTLTGYEGSQAVPARLSYKSRWKRRQGVQEWRR